jgi:hypothetical protein
MMMEWNEDLQETELLTSTDYLNYAKQHQISTTASGPSKSTNPGAPLPQGNALIAYKNLKHKKKCNGRKNRCEMILDIKVVGI